MPLNVYGIKEGENKKVGVSLRKNMNFQIGLNQPCLLLIRIMVFI